MTYDGSALWDFAPNLILCIILLLVLRRQTVAHRVAIAKLDALKQSLDALRGEDAAVDPVAPCRPQHDAVPRAGTETKSRLR